MRGESAPLELPRPTSCAAEERPKDVGLSDERSDGELSEEDDAAAAADDEEDAEEEREGDDNEGEEGEAREARPSKEGDLRPLSWSLSSKTRCVPDAFVGIEGMEDAGWKVERGDVCGPFGSDEDEDEDEDEASPGGRFDVFVGLSGSVGAGDGDRETAGEVLVADGRAGTGGADVAIVGEEGAAVAVAVVVVGFASASCSALKFCCGFEAKRPLRDSRFCSSLSNTTALIPTGNTPALEGGTFMPPASCASSGSAAPAAAPAGAASVSEEEEDASSGTLSSVFVSLSALIVLSSRARTLLSLMSELRAFVSKGVEKRKPRPSFAFVLSPVVSSTGFEFVSRSVMPEESRALISSSSCVERLMGWGNVRTLPLSSSFVVTAFARELKDSFLPRPTPFLFATGEGRFSLIPASRSSRPGQEGGWGGRCVWQRGPDKGGGRRGGQQQTKEKGSRMNESDRKREWQSGARMEDRMAQGDKESEEIEKIEKRRDEKRREDREEKIEKRREEKRREDREEKRREEKIEKRREEKIEKRREEKIEKRREDREEKRRKEKKRQPGMEHAQHLSKAKRVEGMVVKWERKPLI